MEGRQMKEKDYLGELEHGLHAKRLWGLGVIDLRVFNKALLLKWYWYWLKPERRLWKPFFHNTTTITNFLPHTILFTCIEKDMHIFFNISTTHRPGNGTNISLWEHNWGRGLLCMELPNLHSYAINGSITLRQAAFADTLTALFRPNLSTKVHQELQQLQQFLSQLSLRPGEVDDIEWKWRSSNLFSVKSAYKAMKGGPRVVTNTKRIWSVQAPPRMKIFGWLAAQNRILTQDNLARRGWCITNMCVLCRSDRESVRHQFDTCDYAKEVRLKLRAATRFNIGKDHTISTIIDKTATMEQRSALLITQFVIWRERCS